MHKEMKTFIITQLSARRMEIENDLSFWSKQDSFPEMRRCFHLIDKLDKAIEELLK